MYTSTAKHSNPNIAILPCCDSRCSMKAEYITAAVYRCSFQFHIVVCHYGAEAHLALVEVVQASDHDYRNQTDNTQWFVLPGHIANPGKQISCII